ncbi:site-specific integrase [Comamonas terrigena]|uniref:site-specific integrase n=1 Tax=Comamonas terrigena TaxID=32013 RepID=UPI000A9D8EA5|nr:site-specific integrase [Comamonas terrigena]BBL22697.1 integrase [Comamonas terrigena NBRC 13299]SUY92348.1 Uncharacterised protein [Comamonas terrigena]
MNKKANAQELISRTLAYINDSPPVISPEWLFSDFEDKTWIIKLESISTLDFQVRLDDGSILTDEKNRPLIKFFKHFLLAQAHPQFTQGVHYANSSLKGRLDPAIHICEYLVVRAEEFKLGRLGLSALPSSFSHRMLHEVSLYDSADSIYQFRTRLARLLKQGAADLSQDDLLRATSEVPNIAQSGGCDQLELSEEEIQNARAWLWINGYYRGAAYEGGRRFVPDTTLLSELLYPAGVLRSKWTKPVIDSLVIGYGPLLFREIKGVPVRGVERAESITRYYIRALHAAVWLRKFDISVPHGFTEVLSDRQFAQQLPLAGVGRYTTLPYTVALRALRCAVEFSLERVPLLLKAYTTIAKHAAASKSTMTMAARELVASDHPDLSAAGIKCWSISTELRAERSQGLAKKSKQIEETFFREFRRGSGLYELLQVLWGSLLIAIGAIMARRQGELLDLMAGDIFDESRTRLKFLARKRNVGELRERIIRPVPEIIVRFISNLENLQKDFIELGLIKNYIQLLSFPSLHHPRFIECDNESCNITLDRFCDFFEIDKDSTGRRYYIRQHQLRRFFAMLFFYGNSFSSLETLRWFLGHTDAKHLYHYITESTPGEVLKSVKVDFAVDRLRQADASTENLAAILNERFNSTAIQLLDNDELAGLISELMEDGSVTIEPHFFEGHSGQEYVVMIQVERKSTL